MSPLGLRLLFLMALIFSFKSLYAQQGGYATPTGVLDNVFDQRGLKYNLTDVIIDKTGSNGRPPVVLINCNANSIFNLYFEAGCGMEDTGNSAHNARRAVVCKLFQDLSDFLCPPGAPLQPGSATKVNIWVRNISNVYTNPAGYLGMASSFYCLPSSPTIGGIVDGEIWKTIHTGVDSYLNLTVPLTPLGGGGNQSGLFYHGMISFNFNDPSINWNTNLVTTTVPGTQYDLYSAVLHEVVHALGFASLLDANGNSKLGANFKYFSRYDTFLQKSTTPVLTTSSCGMYNNTFNTAAGLTVSALHPGGTCTTDVTNCADAIRFAGTVNVPVYTPNCFEESSSLSHFEDMHFPSCNTLNGDDNYFVMCNAGNQGMMRRYLKPEERSALCDIGYAVKGTYGVSGAYINGTATSFNYGVSACGGISVAGVNDGISNNGDYTFLANQGVNFSLSCSTILSNDVGATGGFVCLQDLTATSSFPTSLSATSGTSASGPITLNSNLAGLHLLRYVPVSSSGARGNITYIYVYVVPNVPGCTTAPNSCNLVNNGRFESNNVNVTLATDFMFNKVCDWKGIGFYTKYFIPNGSTPDFNLPCNLYGYETDNISGNNAYGAILCYGDNTLGTRSGILATELTSALSASTTYQIKFDVSTSEFFKFRNYQLQAFVSSLNPTSITGDLIPNTQLNTGILVSSPNIINNHNGWTTLTLTFTTSALQTNLKYLYIGVLNQPQTAVGTSSLSVPGCADTFNFYPEDGSVYYIDNVSLVATGGAVLDVPSTICSAQILSNLTTYLAAVPTTGFFTGPGVVLTNGIYSFNAASVGPGTYTITYNYNSSSGCPKTITDSIVVSSATMVNPTFNFATNICKNSTAPTLPLTSNNGYSGTWSPATVSNTASGSYTFTPNIGQCANRITIGVAVSNPPIIGSLTPTTQTVCQNATPISLQVTASGGTNLTYQWYSNTANSNTGGTLILGATNAVYTPAVNVIGTKYYYVVITSALGCVTTSNVLTVIITSGTASAGTLSGNQNLCKMGKSNPTTVFTASVAGGTWSVSNTTLASIVTTTASPPTATIRMAPGTATVTYTVTGANGCTASVTRTVTTNIPITPTFTQFPINLVNGVPDPTVICYGGAVPSLPTTSANGITGTWDITTISNTQSNYYIFTPTAGQCASGFGQQVYVVNANDFVTNADFYNLPYAVSTTLTPAIIENDTYTGLTFDNVPSGLNYTISLVGTPPTFPVGGITLNPNGTFTIQPNTTPGYYTFSYKITTPCGQSNVSTVTIRINNYVAHPGKTVFYFCYNPLNQYLSTNSFSAYTSLFDMATVAGAAANSNNASITLLPTVLPGLTVNTNGTFTYIGSGPANLNFYFRICSTATGYCSDPILANIVINSTVLSGNDTVTFYTSGAGNISTNVLSNDSIFDNCPTSSTQATTSNVSLTQLAPFNSYFSITSTGMIYPNTAAPVGTYTLYYQICDLINPTQCSNSTVTIYQVSGTSRLTQNTGFDLQEMMVTPNPSNANFEVIFNRALPDDLTYEVYDALGKKVMENTFEKGIKRGILNLEPYAQGIYLLKLNVNGESISKRLIKN